jgi:hypothetical protein
MVTQWARSVVSARVKKLGKQPRAGTSALGSVNAPEASAMKLRARA